MYVWSLLLRLLKKYAGLSKKKNGGKFKICSSYLFDIDDIALGVVTVRDVVVHPFLIASGSRGRAVDGGRLLGLVGVVGLVVPTSLLGIFGLIHIIGLL